MRTRFAVMAGVLLAVGLALWLRAYFRPAKAPTDLPAREPWEQAVRCILGPGVRVLEWGPHLSPHARQRLAESRGRRWRLEDAWLVRCRYEKGGEDHDEIFEAVWLAELRCYAAVRLLANPHGDGWPVFYRDKRR